ncbi:hypothetical protein GJ496_000992 [Pomphorhynchus laevis]|nr:hypothetical protein GJ496_000992 [Pomphorhynchus laevis]
MSRSYLTNVMTFYDYNLQLQGDYLNLMITKAVVSSFMTKLLLYKKLDRRLYYFPNLYRVEHGDDEALLICCQCGDETLTLSYRRFASSVSTTIRSTLKIRLCILFTCIPGIVRKRRKIVSGDFKQYELCNMVAMSENDVFMGQPSQTTIVDHVCGTSVYASYSG